MNIVRTSFSRMGGSPFSIRMNTAAVHPFLQGSHRGAFALHKDASGTKVIKVTGFEEDPLKRSEITAVLKQRGFRWTPAEKSWVPAEPQPIDVIQSVVDAQKSVSSGAAAVVAKSGEKTAFESRINSFLADKEPELSVLLPKYMDKARFMGHLKTALMGAERVAACSSDAALYTACAKCAQLGLSPGPLQESYFSARDGQIECQIGYKGLIALARRAVPDLQISANIVRNGDEFKYVLGNEPFVELTQNPSANADDFNYAYVMLTYPNGVKTLTVIDSNHVKKRKDCSKGAHASTSPWIKFPREMWLKTAIRDALRFANLSVEESRREELKTAMNEFKEVLSLLQDELEGGSASPSPVQPQGEKQ